MKIRNLAPFSNVRMAVALWMLLSLLLLPSRSLAAETAYAALRAVGERYGHDALQRVVEVNGNNGTWKVSVAAAQEPSRVREIRVRHGKIVSEGKGTKASRVRTPINVNALNLDSDGVLTTLEVETGEQVPEPRVNYALATGSDEITPVWTAKVRGGNAEPTTLQISAETGAVLTRTASPLPPMAAAPDEDARSEDAPQRNSGSSTRRRNGSSLDIPGRIPDEVERTVRRPVRVLRHFLPF
jgi:hypothetical protein